VSSTTYPPPRRTTSSGIAVQLEQSAVLAGLTFSMSLEEVVEAVDDFGGSLDDGNFLLPAGLVGKW
jgi:hypothetical protein